MDTSTLKDKLARFGRAFALLLNRSLMYQKNHPFVQESINEAQQLFGIICDHISPLVFILNREQFYIDDEPLDPRINVKRLATIFKNSAIESISFEKGMANTELGYFVEVFAGLTPVTEVREFKQSIASRGVHNIKVNHVRFKKVTEEDQIISREALRKVAPIVDDEEEQNRKRFMETLLESVLAEEFAQTLNISSLMQDPALVSRNMIQADLNHCGPSPAAGQAGSANAQAGQAGGVGSGFASAPGRAVAAGGAPAAALSPPVAETLPETPVTHGTMILDQLEIIHLEVQKHLQGQSEVPLAELAQAVFDMKRQLFEGIQAQKALGIAYANEEAILEKANSLTDQVLVELIREEYRSGQVPTARLAMLIRRLVPEAAELKRLLPRIKQALLEQGMPVTEYLNLISELKNEFKGEELVRILQESSETIGVDVEVLIDEIKRNPDQAAELIYLASEIQKGTGDASALADIMVGYLEKVGSQMARDIADSSSKQGRAHLKRFIAEIESSLVSQLGRANIGGDMLGQIEERLNNRLDTALDKIRVQWLQSKAQKDESERPQSLSVMQTLEFNVGDDEELAEILQRVRAKVDGGEIGDNDFSSIHAEIMIQRKLMRAGDESEIPEGILTSEDFIFYLGKEIERARRYSAVFTVLAFSLVSAKPQAGDGDAPQTVTKQAVMRAALERLARAFRQVDFIGQIGKNKIVALLPMTEPAAGKKALARVMRLLNAKPLQVEAAAVRVRMAGVAASYDGEQAISAHEFAKHISVQLFDMVSRLKNIQVLF
jgi:hypothetical protein